MCPKPAEVCGLIVGFYVYTHIMLIMNGVERVKGCIVARTVWKIQ